MHSSGPCLLLAIGRRCRVSSACSRVSSAVSPDLEQTPSSFDLPRPLDCMWHLVQVLFEGCNHWLYLEEPAKFNALVRDFVQSGIPAVSKVARV